MKIKTTTDYSHHRLNSDDDLKPYYSKLFKTKTGSITFWKYTERAYRKIVMMVPGETLLVDNIASSDNRDVFIKLVCTFISIGFAQGFSFNTTFTELRRAPALIQPIDKNTLKTKKHGLQRG